MVDLEAYLRRIEYEGPRAPSAAVLRSLHRQHLFTVPFENLDIPLKTPIRLELPLLYEKIVGRRRGGFCYELNGLFYELLTGLGFQVRMLSACVRGENGGFGPEFDHMLLKVELEEPWLADVGFGDSFLNPIPFRSGGADEVNERRYVVEEAGNEWQLVREDNQGQVPLYRFRDVPRQLADYEEMCRFQQTSPESHFTKSWICSKATPHGRITLANMRLITTNDGVREENVLTTQAEVRRCLRDQVGIQLPESVDLSALSA
jgi:N-hydroxyarylamine O-acetyltransferase